MGRESGTAFVPDGEVAAVLNDYEFGVSVTGDKSADLGSY